MLSILNIAASAASAQSQRLNVVASNLANADTVAGPTGQAYKARQVTLQTELMGQTANDPTAAGVRVRAWARCVKARSTGAPASGNACRGW